MFKFFTDVAFEESEVAQRFLYLAAALSRNAMDETGQGELVLLAFFLSTFALRVLNQDDFSRFLEHNSKVRLIFVSFWET
jgi:hypothetical protein